MNDEIVSQLEFFRDIGIDTLDASPSGRGRHDSHAKREPDRAKPQEMPGAPGEGHKFSRIQNS